MHKIFERDLPGRGNEDTARARSGMTDDRRATGMIQQLLAESLAKLAGGRPGPRRQGCRGP